MKTSVSSLQESLSAGADVERRRRTSEAFARHPSSQALDPVDTLLRFFHRHRVALLQDFVYRYKSLEGLHFIRHYRLPVRRFCQTPSSRWKSAHTLSSLPRKMSTTCGPMCRQYNS